MTYQYKKGDTGKTRGGHDYEIVATDLHIRPIGVILTYKDGSRVFESYYSGGKFLEPIHALEPFHTLDLMPPIVRTSLWANEYANSEGGHFLASPYTTREQAGLARHSNCTALIELIFENGKAVGLDRHEVTP